MADWRIGRLMPGDLPEHISGALDRVLRSEQEIFCGRTATGARVRVFRVAMPALDVAESSGVFETMGPNVTTEALLDKVPWKHTWHVTWRCVDRQPWPDDTSEMVATRIEQGPLRMQAWMFQCDAGAAVRLCATLWGFDVKLPKEQEAN